MHAPSFWRCAARLGLVWRIGAAPALRHFERRGRTPDLPHLITITPKFAHQKDHVTTHSSPNMYPIVCEQ